MQLQLHMFHSPTHLSLLLCLFRTSEHQYIAVLNARSWFQFYFRSGLISYFLAFSVLVHECWTYLWRGQKTNCVVIMACFSYTFYSSTAQYNFINNSYCFIHCFSVKNTHLSKYFRSGCSSNMK